MADNWLRAYQQHFEKYFKKPFDIQVYAAGGLGLKLATHDWAMRGFRVYASLGVADRLVREEQPDFGEVILFADAPDKSVPPLFVNALFFILQHSIPLSSRFSIGFGGGFGDFARRYGKTALYFTRPAEEDDPVNEVFQGDRLGRVYQAYFITPQEDAFLGAQGAEAFEAEFFKQFAAKLSDEDRVELTVDKTKADQLQSKLQETWVRTARAFGLRRPSCV